MFELCNTKKTTTIEMRFNGFTVNRKMEFDYFTPAHETGERIEFIPKWYDFKINAYS